MPVSPMHPSLLSAGSGRMRLRGANQLLPQQVSPGEDIKGAVLLCCMSNLLNLLKVGKNNHNHLQRASHKKKPHKRKRASQAFS